jgi:hypothetical protein
MWGGPSLGVPCAICTTALQRGEPEYEIDFDRDGAGSGTDTYNVHIRCFEQWTAQLGRS